MSWPLAKECARVCRRFCLLLTIAGFLAHANVATAGQSNAQATEPPPRSAHHGAAPRTFNNALFNANVEQVEVRDALKALSEAAKITLNGAALVQYALRPITLSSHQRAPIQALSTIMAQVPGGGFVFVEGQHGEQSRAYVLGGRHTELQRGTAVIDVVPRRQEAAQVAKHHIVRSATGTQQAPEAEYIANELLLQFPPELSVDDVRHIVEAFDGILVGADDDPLHKIGYFRARFSDGSDVMAIAPRLVDESPAEMAEPNYVATALDSVPNDPLYLQQWGLMRTQVPAAWDLTVGQGDILVAVLDSGIDPSHPELEGALTDGWDFITDDADPTDEQGHGTAMSGIIAAAIDNEQGIAGIAPGVRLMPVRVLDGAGKGSYAEVMNGLIYAADRGARLINMSFGGYGESRALSLALAYAYQKGSLLIGAAGNQGIEAIVFPAADPLVIGVASTNINDERSIASNWGPHVLLAAPGERVATLLPHNAYALVTGTSAAAAQVTGIAALVFSIKPELGNIGCAQLLVDTAEDLGPPGWDEEFGFGQVNAVQAVTKAADL